MPLDGFVRRDALVRAFACKFARRSLNSPAGAAGSMSITDWKQLPPLQPIRCLDKLTRTLLVCRRLTVFVVDWKGFFARLVFLACGLH